MSQAFKPPSSFRPCKGAAAASAADAQPGLGHLPVTQAGTGSQNRQIGLISEAEECGPHKEMGAVLGNHWCVLKCMRRKSRREMRLVYANMYSL